MIYDPKAVEAKTLDQWC